MNVHFFVTFSKDASNSVFAQELKKQNINFRIFSEQVSLRYSHRIWLYLIGWPRMLLFSVRQAWRSLKTEPKPDWIVVGSHFEVIAVTIIGMLFKKHKSRVMLLGFIYTARKSPFLTKLKFLYFSKILAWVDCVVCHSDQEVLQNRHLFKLKATSFEYIPYGLHLAMPEQGLADYKGEPYAVSAGRSGRDYDLLVKCFTQLNYPLHIICDSTAVIKDQLLPQNIKILRHCYGHDYINELANAKMVVIPVAADNISAGQMVLIQAMALSKPIIITDTNTTVHYVEKGKTALLVEKGSAEQMIKAVEELWSNEVLAKDLAKNAIGSFDKNYSMAAYIRGISNLLSKL